MKNIGVMAVVALAALLASCAAQQNVPSYSELLSEITGQNGRACVRTADIDGYGVLDGDVVSIDSDFNYYLATVLPGCIDLTTSVGALFRGDFNEVCGQSMDRIYTTFDGDQCLINQMYEFEDREAAFAAYNQAQERREEIREGGQ